MIIDEKLREIQAKVLEESLCTATEGESWETDSRSLAEVIKELESLMTRRSNLEKYLREYVKTNPKGYFLLEHYGFNPFPLEMQEIKLEPSEWKNSLFPMFVLPGPIGVDDDKEREGWICSVL